MMIEHSTSNDENGHASDDKVPKYQVDDIESIDSEEDDDIENATAEEMDEFFVEEKELKHMSKWDSDDDPKMVALRGSMKELVVEVNRATSDHEKRVRRWVTEVCPMWSDVYANKDQLISFVRSSLPAKLANASSLINEYRQFKLAQIEKLDSLSSLSQEEKVKIRNDLYEARKLRKKIQRYTDRVFKKFSEFYNVNDVRKFENLKATGFQAFKLGEMGAFINDFDLIKLGEEKKRAQGVLDLEKATAKHEEDVKKHAAEQEEKSKKMEEERLLGLERDLKSKDFLELKQQMLGKKIQRNGNITTLTFN